MAGMFSEADWEGLALDTLLELDWEKLTGTDVAFGEPDDKPRRAGHGTLEIPVLVLEALRRLNPDLPESAVQEAASILLKPRSENALEENRDAHGYLVEGLRKVELSREDGTTWTPTIRVISRDPDENVWHAVQQVTLKTVDQHRRFDVVLYCNGLPIGVVELKKNASETADCQGAYNQIQTYVREFPTAFRWCLLTIVSDGFTARYGTPFTPYDHMARWNVDDDGEPVGADENGEVGSALEVLLYGVCNQARLLDLLFGFTTFSVQSTQAGQHVLKIVAKPHQYFAVSKAVARTLEAYRSDGKIGVVWHTQGSGKSLEMVFYAAQIMRHPQLANPTLVVVTDRTDLDDQLANTFRAAKILPEEPVSVDTRAQLREELTGRTHGGLYFTTLQKFGLSPEEKAAGATHPQLSDRHNVIVVVDEAHRSHYDNLDGYARHIRDALPHASFIAFTGTPVSRLEAHTTGTFGEYVDVYDLTRAIDDGATVPVKFESRYIPLRLSEDVTVDDISDEAARLTATLDEAEREKVQKRVAQLSALYGAPDRVSELAQDFVAHWEQRRELMRPLIGGPGKAMIVGATREVCARIHDAIIALRPDWVTEGIDTGVLKVLYTGSPSDDAYIGQHVRKAGQSKALQKRMKDVDDELEILIVQSMLLTGFDAPPLHTLYLDRPMQGALLMQTLARVNRRFRGKEDALLVGYCPIVENLKAALGEYTGGGQQSGPSDDDVQRAAEQGVDILHDIEEHVLGGVDYKPKLTEGSMKAAMQAVGMTVNYLAGHSDPPPPKPGAPKGEQPKSLLAQFNERATQLRRLYSFAGSEPTFTKYKHDVAFVEEVRVSLAKRIAEERSATGQQTPADVQRLLENYTSGLLESGQVQDLYQLAGIPNPEIHELNKAFAEELVQAENKNLALEALRRAIQKQMRDVTRHNVVRQEMYGERLSQLTARYNNAQLSFAEVIYELMNMGDDLKQDAQRGQQFDPPLEADELVFYDVLNACRHADLEAGEDTLAQIARDIVQSMRTSPTNWQNQADVRAKLRTVVKRLLKKYKYPPQDQVEARRRIIEQMELLAEIQ